MERAQYTLMIEVEDECHFFAQSHSYGNKEQAYEYAEKLREKLPENLAVYVRKDTTDNIAHRVGEAAIWVDHQGRRRNMNGIIKVAQ